MRKFVETERHLSFSQFQDEATLPNAVDVHEAAAGRVVCALSSEKIEDLDFIKELIEAGKIQIHH
jgi:hypothetical protein